MCDKTSFNHCLIQETFGKHDQKSLCNVSLVFSITDCIRKLHSLLQPID